MITIASHIMTFSPARLNVNDLLSKAVHLMVEGNFRHLPVVDNRKVVGMVSIFDLIVIKPENIDNTTAGQIMTTPALTTRIDSSLEKVVQLFTKQNMHAIPVVDFEGQLAGIISSVDLIDYLNN